MVKKNNKMQDNKGVTGIDLTISLILFTIFAGLIASLMVAVYKTSIEIQKSANAMSYATIILEKVDEKSFEEIGNEFVDTLKSDGEVTIDSGYNVDFSTKTITENFFKVVTITVSYNVAGEEKTLTMNKLKVKEIYLE